MYYRISLFFFLFALSISIYGQTSGDAEQVNPEVLKQPDVQPTFTVAINHFPPYSILNEGSPPSGTNVDAIKIIAEKLQMQVDYIECPFARCVVLLKRGIADVFIGLSYDEERAEFLHYVEPYIATGSVQGFYVRKDSGITIGQFTDLEGLVVGMIRHSLYFAQFDQSTSVTKFEANSHSQLIDLLLYKRIDTFIGSEDRLRYLLQKEGLSDRIIQQKFSIADDRKVYLVLSKRSKHTGSLELISDALAYAISKNIFKIPVNADHSDG
ncbi:transporter substrate-binding domain-containing protein [Alteromonas sp. ASW11-36]|uniref:Transporter substrate-binding domain-containing protein n=1 Tax=Alteromonas arenosi TaxID=3055817 RepID=A0ABT7SSS6_9ALTE|nr:transporter substrate-binding domain-containing protein [Alteromonas sp. ASW11-36]MDM7859248.1 transporter substrate-binding domain-containing protein [Alteromonas sp. ASW11-36]